MSTREGGRRIKVEVRGLPETRHTLMYICEKMSKVRDVASKLTCMYDDIRKTDEIKIYLGKFHLPDNENINIIKDGEEIIVFRKATETEYYEQTDDKKALVNVREKVLNEKEDELEKKEINLKDKEESLKEVEATSKIKEEELEEKKSALEKSRLNLEAKEDILEKREKEVQLKEREVESKEKALDLAIQKKEEEFSKILASKEDELKESRTTILQLKKIGQTMRAKFLAEEAKVNALRMENKAKEEVLEHKEREVELKEKALDLTIQKKEEEFSKILAFKEEELKESRTTILQLKKIGQTMRAKFLAEEAKVNALTMENNAKEEVLEKGEKEVQLKENNLNFNVNIEERVASLQNSVSTSDSPYPLQKKRKIDLPLSSKQVPIDLRTPWQARASVLEYLKFQS